MAVVLVLRTSASEIISSLDSRWRATTVIDSSHHRAYILEVDSDLMTSRLNEIPCECNIFVF